MLEVVHPPNITLFIAIYANVIFSAVYALKCNASNITRLTLKPKTYNNDSYLYIYVSNVS